MKKIKSIFLKYKQALITVAIIVVAGLITLIIVVHKNSKTDSGLLQLNQVTSAVGKLIILPKNETPTLATVNDITKLKNQAIFANAQNDDKVLVYSKAQEIIVYRPSAGKIVSVGPLILDKKGSPYVNSSIAILNGSGNSDLLAKMTRAVVSAFPNSTIVQKDVAPRTFPTSISVDLTKQKQTLDEQIADTLGIKAGQIPLGIHISNADFLIIIGEDYK